MHLRCLACGVRVKPTDAYCRRCGARAPTSAPPAEPMGTVSLAAHLPGTAADDAEQEVELWSGTFSSKGMIREALVAALVTVVLWGLRSSVVTAESPAAALIGPAILAIWLLLAGLLVYRKLDAGYTITDQRLLHRHGILYRRTHRIEVIDIDDLRYEQGILEQLLGVGRIIVNSSDATHDELVMRGIDRVGEVFDTLEQARRRERLQHGLHVEAV